MVLLLAMTLWPEDHYFDSIPLPDPYGYNGMGMVREHLPGDHDLSARQEFSFRDGCSHRFTRDDSFSVLARRIESIFAPASTK